MKSSAPAWGFGTQTRGQFRKVFISSSHPQDLLGCDSPGPLYTPEASENAKKLKPVQTHAFAKAPRAQHKTAYPAPSNDLLGKSLPDCSAYKQSWRGRPQFGKSDRTAPVNAPDLEGFDVGGVSPGPAFYTSKRLIHAPSFTMRARGRPQFQMNKSELRPSPVDYKQPGSMGKQPSARVPSRPLYSFSKANRFGSISKSLTEEGGGCKLGSSPDTKGPSGDATGQLRLKYQRNFNVQPSWSMGAGTRDGRQKLAMALLAADSIKVAGSEKHPSIPNNIPNRREVVTLTDKRTDIN